MTEEIKEILDNLELVSKKQYGVEELFDDDMIGILYNYITNLQQENERLKEDNLLIKSANKLVSDNLHNYKSRCEKANIILHKLDFDNFVYGKTALKDIKKNLINILNGSDENE